MPKDVCLILFRLTDILDSECKICNFAQFCMLSDIQSMQASQNIKVHYLKLYLTF